MTELISNINHQKARDLAASWITLAASEVGTSHFRKKVPCQDSCQITATTRHLVLGAIADGVGSAARAEIGSQIAVQTAMSCLVREEDALLLSTEDAVRTTCLAALRCAVEAIHTRATDDHRSPDDYACTLILLVLSPTWIAALSVGDGFVTWRSESASQYEVLLPPEKGEFVNYTATILSGNLEECARFEIQFQQPAFAFASSDGLLFLALKNETWLPHQPFFGFLESLARRPDVSPELLRDFLKNEQVNALTDDDKSALIVCSKHGTLPRVETPEPARSDSNASATNIIE